MKAKHLDEQWLRQKYLVEELSTYEIGRIVGRDPKRVYEKLVDFKIPTRPRGRNLSKTSGKDNFRLNNPGTNPFHGPHTDESKAIMRAKASHPKPHLRGAKNGMFGKTGAQSPTYKDGTTPTRQREYNRHRWCEARRLVNARDGKRCVRCGAAETTKRSIHIHHIKPFDTYPEHRCDLKNLVTLCGTCHRWVHSPNNVAGEFL